MNMMEKRPQREKLFVLQGTRMFSAIEACILKYLPGCEIEQLDILDFGCGVGRVTRPLAAHFAEVIGVDVSSSMIERARALTTDSRCRFVVNASPDLRQFNDQSFDFVYSRIVLQHLPPAIAGRYISEMVRVLVPGGVLLFQVPTPIASGLDAFLASDVQGPLKRRLPRAFVRRWRRFKYSILRLRRFGMRRIDMYGLARDEVTAIVESSGAQIREVRDDNAHGTAEPGYQYCCVKRAAARLDV